MPKRASPSPGRCDAGKLGCVAKRQACLLAVHATAEKEGEAPVAEALQKRVDTFGGCIAKLESKQNLAKPKTLCSVTGDLVALTSAGDAFVTDVVTTIPPIRTPLWRTAVHARTTLANM